MQGGVENAPLLFIGVPVSVETVRTVVLLQLKFFKRDIIGSLALRTTFEMLSCMFRDPLVPPHAPPPPEGKPF